MNRIVVLTLVLALALCVRASSLLADGATQTRSQTQTQTQTQTGDCGDCPNCDGDCCQNQSGNAYQGDLADGFQYLFRLMLKFFGGGE